MSELLIYILLAIVVNVPIGFFAYKKKALRVPDGISAAAITGFILFITHPILWVVLLTFFASSTMLTKFKDDSTQKTEAMKYAEKGGQRDAYQVLANGGVSVVYSLTVIGLMGFISNEFLHPLFIIIVTSYAASAADTWATEIGTTSFKEPVWIFDLKKRVPRGTSGGVSMKGTIGTALGALIIAIFYSITVLIFDSSIELSELFVVAIIITIGGILGSLIDTVIGASIQGLNKCPQCDKITEKTWHQHKEAIRTKHVSGWKWMSNDMVNFLSGLISSSFIGLIYFITI